MPGDIRDVASTDSEAELPAFDDLIRSLLLGELTVEQAEKDVGELATSRSPSLEVVHRWLQQAQELARSRDWQRAWAIVRIIRAASKATTTPQLPQELRLRTAEPMIEVASWSLRCLPHPEICASAVEIASDALQIADVRKREDFRGAFLYYLGCLHKDPYLSGRPYAELEGQLRRWYLSLSQLGNEVPGAPIRSRELLGWTQ